jgi:sulfopyruvate decarboxylase subunit alpha
MSQTDDIFQGLLRLGVTHGVGLPDSVTAPLIARIDEHPEMTWTPVTREGEAFSIASGLWVGGKIPVVIVQNTGVLESGDSLRGVALRMGVPLLCIVTYRGRAKMLAAGWTPTPTTHSDTRPGQTLDRDWLLRPDVDSTALLTEPTLQAWKVPYRIYESPQDLDATWDLAQNQVRPAILLLPKAAPGAISANGSDQ